jgi:AraC-like DNA-binding protein
MNEFSDEYCDAEIFFGNEIRLINEQLAEAITGEAMVNIVERFLLSKYRVERKHAIDVVATHLLSHPTSFSLGQMADEACLSTKQFYRNFVQRIGISPKFFSRLSRFNRAYQYKLAHQDVSWSSIAQEFSYTDYHHLEKEFKSFLGVTPTEWIKIEHKAPERILKLR